MSHTLSFRQNIVLASIVILAMVMLGWGLLQVANKQGIGKPTTEFTLAFSEAHDIGPGTPVRIRGIEAGQVIAVEYPADDSEASKVLVRLRVDAKYAQRIYADSTAHLHSTGMLGSKVIAISPGTPKAGPLADGQIATTETPDLAHAVAKLSATAEKFGETADEAKLLVHEARAGNGTITKLLKDDSLFTELNGLLKDSRTMVKRADTAVDTVEKKTTDVDRFVQDGRDTLRSVKQGTDAVQKLPIIRGYVEDAAAILTRPECRREAVAYSAETIFEADSAILTDTGKHHLDEVIAWLKGIKNDKAEVVIATLHNPESKTQTPASAAELTKKQAETIVDYLKSNGAGKLGWFTRRKMTALGLAQGPSPLVEAKPLPASYVQIHLFTPQ